MKEIVKLKKKWNVGIDNRDEKERREINERKI